MQHSFKDEASVLPLMLREPDADPERLPEAVIQDIWQHLRFKWNDLTTTTNQSIIIQEVGRHNLDQGPDFLMARLNIGDVDWAGDVEIHRTSSDWIKHGHHEDSRYNSVVLHVTLIEDMFTGRLTREDGSLLPELVLYPRLETPLRQLLYQFYTRAEVSYACAASWPSVPASIRKSWITTLGRERLKEKVERLRHQFLKTPNLEDVLYRLVFRALGYTKNADAMQDLASRIPLAGLRSVESLLDIEAILLGTAGLIPKPDTWHTHDPKAIGYAKQLQTQFLRHQTDLKLQPMPANAWQFFRLRPANFPTLRIAQAATLLQSGGLLYHDPLGQLLDTLSQKKPITALRRLLSVRASEFWQSHVRFEQPARGRHSGKLGKQRMDTLLTNAILPALLLHAEQMESIPLEQDILNVYAQLPAEHDEITRRYDGAGLEPIRALHTQGLHQLYRTRCTQGKCLNCPVGRHILDG